MRAEALLTELDVLQKLRPKAKTAVITEARRQPGWKILRPIPFLGPVRVAQILAIMATRWRFRTKRQAWPYAGLAVRASIVREASSCTMQSRMKRLLNAILGGSRNTARTAPKGRRRTAAELDRWESAHSCKLPLEYRSLLTDFGEGVYYPFGELVPLSKWWDHLTGASSCHESLFWLQATFEIPEQLNSTDEWESWLAHWQQAYPGRPAPWAGTIALTDDGCGMLSLLVVNGPETGRVCALALPEPPRLFPHKNVLEWYQAALEAEKTRSFAAFAPWSAA